MQISLSEFEKTAALVYGVLCYVLGMIAGARTPFDASFFLAAAAGFFGIVLLSYAAAFLAALLEYLQWHWVEQPPVLRAACKWFFFIVSVIFTVLYLCACIAVGLAIP